MGCIKLWQTVPDGSHLELWVEPEEDSGDHPWSSRARALDDQGTEEIFDDSELTPGPAELPLSTPRIYDVRLRVVMGGDGEGTIRARIVKPGGSVFGSEFACPFEGGAGDVHRASIGVKTLQGGG